MMKRFFKTVLTIGVVISLFVLCYMFFAVRNGPKSFFQLLPNANGISEYAVTGVSSQMLVQVPATEKFGELLEEYLLYPIAKNEKIEWNHERYLITYGYQGAGKYEVFTFTITDMGKVEINGDMYEIRPWEENDFAKLQTFLKENTGTQ